jgi:hypothetical protein
MGGSGLQLFVHSAHLLSIDMSQSGRVGNSHGATWNVAVLDLSDTGGGPRRRFGDTADIASPIPEPTERLSV